MLTIIVLVIGIIAIILYKKRNARTALLFLGLICFIAFFTKPSEKMYLKTLEEDYFLQCDEIMKICTSISSDHEFQVELYRVYNIGIFNFYRLKMWYGGKSHLREIDTMGAFYQFSPFTDR